MDEKAVQEKFEKFYKQFMDKDAKDAFHTELVMVMRLIKDALYVAFAVGYELGSEIKDEE